MDYESKGVPCGMGQADKEKCLVWYAGKRAQEGHKPYYHSHFCALPKGREIHSIDTLCSSWDHGNQPPKTDLLLAHLMREKRDTLHTHKKGIDFLRIFLHPEKDIVWREVQFFFDFEANKPSE